MRSNKDIPENIRFLLLMLIHDAYKVSYYWEKIAGNGASGKLPLMRSYRNNATHPHPVERTWPKTGMGANSEG
jgi:hypothetical protein